MAPTLKNAKPQGTINPVNWASRFPDNADSTLDYFTKQNCSFHGFLVNNGAYIDQTGAKQTISGGNYNTTNAIVLVVGPYNEVTVQPVGGGTVTIKGALYSGASGSELVNCNTVTSADGFTRIQSLYKVISISATGLAATGSLYLQIW